MGEVLNQLDGDRQGSRSGFPGCQPLLASTNVNADLASVYGGQQLSWCLSWCQVQFWKEGCAMNILKDIPRNRLGIH
jgi:hypothetical protein